MNYDNFFNYKNNENNNYSNWDIKLFLKSNLEKNKVIDSIHTSNLNDSFSNSNSKKLSDAFGVDNSILMTPSYKEEKLEKEDKNDSNINKDDKTISLILSDKEENNEIIDNELEKNNNIKKKLNLKVKLKNKKIIPFNPNDSNCNSNKKHLNKTINFDNNNEVNSTEDSFGNFSTKSNDSYYKIGFLKKFSLNNNFIYNDEINENNIKDINNNHLKLIGNKMNKYKKYNKKKFENMNEDEFNINLKQIANNKKSTLMIKNIPNKYTKEMMLSRINEKFKNKYDFFYLPIDFENNCNVGYAFINFQNNNDIKEFYLEFNNKKWKKFKSDKICQIKYARIQGSDENKFHFKDSGIMKKEDQNLKPFMLKQIESIHSLIDKQKKLNK